ncbi:hypothetical protein SEVIR_3G115976v4 [Setaria viridis]
MAHSTVPKEDWSLDTDVLLDKVFTYPSILEVPYEIFPNKWAHEPAKIKYLVRRAIMCEYWKRRRSSKQSQLSGPTVSFSNDVLILPIGWVSCLHVTASKDPSIMTTKRFAILQPNEESATQDGAVRQELHRLQDQMAQLGMRLRDQEMPESSAARSRSRME